jgi:hypothetical protein
MIHVAVVALSLLGQDGVRDVAWEAAGRKARVGDLTVGVLAVRRGKVPLVHLREKTASEDDLLSVYLGIQNHSETKKHDYRGWSTKNFDLESKSRARASDELGNGYKRIRFDIFSKVEDQLAEGESVYPEKVVLDVLIFELPIDKAKELRLTLPGEAIGSRGPILLKVSLSPPNSDGIVFDYKREKEAEERTREIERRKEEARLQDEAEAKKTPEQKAAEKKKRDEEAAAKQAAEEKAKADKDEKAAAAKLKSAESLLKAGKADSYRKILKEIAEKYPETEAGKKAAKALK